MAAPVKPADVEKALVAKGMVRTATQKHHVIFTKTIRGLLTLHTRISHNSPPIDDYLMGAMAGQCCLPLSEFRQLIDCPLTEAQWDQRVTELAPDGRNPFLRSGH
jgi:hypothetical protein